MANESFSLQILSLKFGTKSLAYITFGFCSLGILLGILSMIHIDNPSISTVATMPLIWTIFIPIVLIIKGILKAEITDYT